MGARAYVVKRTSWVILVAMALSTLFGLLWLYPPYDNQSFACLWGMHLTYLVTATAYQSATHWCLISLALIEKKARGLKVASTRPPPAAASTRSAAQMPSSGSTSNGSTPSSANTATVAEA